MLLFPSPRWCYCHRVHVVIIRLVNTLVCHFLRLLGLPFDRFTASNDDDDPLNIEFPLSLQILHRGGFYILPITACLFFRPLYPLVTDERCVP